MATITRRRRPRWRCSAPARRTLPRENDTGDAMKKVTPVALVAILGLVPIFAQVATHVPNEPRFDVVSIKKVPADGLPTGNSVRVGPDGGVSLSALPVGTLVRMAYPPRGKVYDFVGLPEWATRDRYDVIA